MGVSISWLAVRTDDPGRLFDIAEVDPTPDADESLESSIAGGALRGGWYFLQAQGCEHPIVSSDSLSKISALGETIACSIEEHVMTSVVEGWNNGSRSWSIAHDAQEGIFDLSTNGDLPARFEEIRNDYISQQNAEGGEHAEVDFVFEIPLEVAKSICGYKHDEGSAPWVPPGPVRFTQAGTGRDAGGSVW